MSGEESVPEDRRAWWARHRRAVLAAVVVGYLISVVWYELFTPWWAGDHVGLSLATLVFLYGWGAMLCVALAYPLYGLAPLSEALVRPLDKSKYRRRLYPAIIAFGLLAPSIWMGVSVIDAWLRHR